MDQSTFKNTVFILKDKLYRFAKSMLKDEEDAFDLVQEMLLKFWQNRDELSKVNNIEAYAMRCVRNEIVNKSRHAKVVQLFQNQLFERVQDAEYPAMTKEIILKLINDLPEKQKAVIHLRDVEEYEIAEIKEVLGMEENAIRSNLMRARNKVKFELQKIFDYEKGQINRIGR
ncbi:RNA polymerase sigma factor [Sphingobacterium hungaricum]|uniref:RNA polymerase n=1 Tax=Sphingobacterium hungaricum TaxID=2082723 RepID=A0A928UUA3_9SPHI|nr:RNA polymerase sigma factor [Sphingobacterium hungaricum]MBE8712867.1 RNA polymerase [Sphingobacterium hungaricum]